MSRPQRYAVLALFLGGSWLTSAGCSSDDAASAGATFGGSGQGAFGQGGSQAGSATVVNPGGSSAGGGVGRLRPLCGAQEDPEQCVPDDARACRNYRPPTSDGGAGAGGAAAGGAGGEGGNGGEGGSVGGTATAGAPPAAGAPSGGADGGGAPGSGGQGGAEREPGGGGQGGQAGEAPVVTPAPKYGCQVSRQNNQPYRSCAPAGPGIANAPCFSAADCTPGLTCVTEGEAGRCLPYCCDLSTACDAGSYCAERQLRRAPSDSTEGDTRLVPVCVPADGCSLEDRYPCPSGEDCRCKGDTACMLVRNDGTTSCVEPGKGKQGESCPCAWNHVCSELTSQCMKICRTDATVDECGEQKCQASSELPGNFGLCVGTRP